MTDKQYPDLDPHQSERSNLIPHQSKRSDSDPHQSEEADPNFAWKTIFKPFATDLFANVRYIFLTPFHPLTTLQLQISTVKLDNNFLEPSVADPNPDPDPPDPCVFGPSGSGSTSQSYGSGSGSFYHHAQIVRKTLIPTI